MYLTKAAKGALFLLALIALFSLMGPWLSPYSYDATDLKIKNTPPSFSHLFGTDDLGRDLFTRTWYGARISLSVGLIAALIDLVVGVSWAAVATLHSARTDEWLMRIADILYSLPCLLVIILLIVVMGPGFSSIILALTVTGWVTMARVARGQFLQLREKEFFLAAVIIGVSKKRLLTHYLLLNSWPPIIATLSLTIPTAIFAEAFLSFLGLGVQAPMASWGVMASDGLPALYYYPWRLLIPAFWISVTMLGFNMVGDGIKEAR